jgi:hypothetical protein
MSAADTTTAAFTLAGALGGVALTGLIGALRTSSDHRHELVVKNIDERRERATYFRTERRSVYGAFLFAADDAWQLANDLFRRKTRGESLDFREETRAVISELTSQALMVALVGTERVQSAADGYVARLRELLIAAAEDGQLLANTREPREQLIAAMRSALDDLIPSASNAPAESALSRLERWWYQPVRPSPIRRWWRSQKAREQTLYASLPASDGAT